MLLHSFAFYGLWGFFILTYKVEEFTAIYGFKDTNDDFHIDNTDPYAHVKAKGIFSIQGLYLSDAFATLDENEPLFNLPHGYLTYDDVKHLKS